ncbi:hypothetical protein ACH4TP_37865 [Streptomyces sp. NPDC021012]|uniref:hypothetical protein n=1 Tax=Streptomyces sp. NPDC021012 TaxID=3365107 RepID=UPI0037B39357
MPQPALHTLCALAGVLAGYSAATLYHRRRARVQALHDRLIRAGDARHTDALRARLAAHRAEGDVVTAATDLVDAAYARLARNAQEGGPTP